jgi:hypothetical protein
MKNEIVEINGAEFLCPRDGDNIFVAIKPACEFLGIDPSSQMRNLKNDSDFLGSTVVNMTTVGADGKDREMVCLPLQFFFGWLAQIDHTKVKEEIRPTVIQYKLEVCNVLYNHFMGARRFLEEKEKMIGKLNDRLKIVRKNFSNAKSVLSNTEDAMDKVARMTYEEYKETGFQMDIDFES